MSVCLYVTNFKEVNEESNRLDELYEQEQKMFGTLCSLVRSSDTGIGGLIASVIQGCPLPPLCTGALGYVVHSQECCNGCVTLSQNTRYELVLHSQPLFSIKPLHQLL